MILYKYLSPSRFDVLQKAKIRFTQPAAFNDPFDILPVDRQLVDRDEEEIRGIQTPQSQMICSVLLEDLHNKGLIDQKWSEQDVRANFIAAYREVASFIQRQHRRGYRGVMRLFDWLSGILCLSRIPDNMIMWSHYASGHTGYVIGFSTDDPFFSKRLWEVKYNRERPQIFPSDAIGESAFTTKSPDWEYEQEWRLVKTFDEGHHCGDRDGFPIMLFDLPKSAVHCVILGARMFNAAPEREKLLSVLEEDSGYGEVKLFQAELDDRNFQVNLVPTTLESERKYCWQPRQN